MYDRGAPMGGREGMMKERPILFTGPMVRAILDGSKTQTRRVVKSENEPSPGWDWADCLCREIDRRDTPCEICSARFGESPYGVPGDQLWVRETWGVKRTNIENYGAAYPGKAVSCKISFVFGWEMVMSRL